MSTTRHVLGVVGAGVLAFGAIFAAVALTAPGAAAPQPGPASPGESDPAEGTAPGAPLAERIVGRWVAASPTNVAAYLEITEHGLWLASDGCNSADGSWALADDGSLETTSGPLTQIGCDNDAAPLAIASAVAAAVDGDTLSLTDEGGVTTKLVREDDEAIGLAGMWIGPGTEQTATVISFAPGGSWTASAGCSSLSGTWTLGPVTEAATDLPEGSDEAPALVFSHGVLRTGAIEHEPIPNCSGTDEALPGPFAADTDYWFRFGRAAQDQADSFAVAPVDPANPEPEFTQFTRVVVAAG